ncbi:CACTA transposable element [Tanacetum coccineum]
MYNDSISTHPLNIGVKASDLSSDHSVGENHREEEDQEGNNSPEIETLPLFPIHGGSHHDFLSVKATDLSSDHSVGVMVIDKSWTSLGKHEKAFYTGLKKFVDDCKPLVDSAGNIRCPCKSCRLVLWVSIKHLSDHISKYGFDPSYKTWIHHGEPDLPLPLPVIDNTRQPQMSDMTACLNDLSYIPLNNEQNEPTQGDIGETSNDPTQAKRNEFEELYASANEELYPGCDYVTRLDFMAKFTCFKVKGYESIHACVNDCFLFRGDANKDVHFCPVCNTSRWKDNNTPGKKVPKKVLRYFSIIPRLQRLYKSSHTAKEMTWHAIGKCTEPGKMQHPVDGRSWKDFDTKYPDFAAEPRNVRLGLAVDGFNPFSNLTKLEGSIAEGYVAEETLTFSSHYFHDVTTKFNRPDRNVDCPPPTCQFQVFKSLCKSIGLWSVIRIDHQELKKVIWYVLHNSPEIDTYRAKFNSEFPNRDMKEEFPGWFGKQIHQRHIDNDPGVSESSELFALACGPSQTPISVVKHVSHKKFSNEGVIVVEDDPDVIHVDNSSDLILSASLNDLEIAALHIDGQSIDVDAPPDIIDVMSADVARGHGGNGGGDDRPLPHQIPTGCGGPYAPAKEDYNGKKAALKERYWVPEEDGTYDLERLRRGRPCTFLRSGNKFSQMLTQLESQPEYGGGSGSGGCRDDEPGNNEDGGQDEEDEDDS